MDNCYRRRQTIHVANQNTLGNPDIDARSADYVMGGLTVGEYVDGVALDALGLVEEAEYLAHSIHKKGRP